MGQVVRILSVLAILAASALPLAAFDGPTQTKGASKKADAGGKQEQTAAAGAKSKTATKAQEMLERGIKAFEAGRPNQAVRAFNTALDSGTLAGPQLARALYYRGMAYGKHGKPGLAIADLTGAIWLKNGLSAAEKQEALKARVAAYRAAGISDVPPIDGTAAVAYVDTGAASSGGWQTAMADVPASGPSASPSPVLAAAPQSAPAPAASSSSGGFFDSITGFFGGSSSSAPSPQEDSVTTASIGNGADREPPAAAGWSQSTQVAAVAPPPPPQVPAAAPPPPPPPAPAVTSAFETQVAAAPPEQAPEAEPATSAAAPPTQYHIQIAAVRTRSEAYALSVRLVSQYGRQFGARRPEVEETVIGSMGTFYRVRVGPYASAEESRRLCSALQANGFDCLIETQ